MGVFLLSKLVFLCIHLLVSPILGRAVCPGISLLWPCWCLSWFSFVLVVKRDWWLLSTSRAGLEAKEISWEYLLSAGSLYSHSVYGTCCGLDFNLVLKKTGPSPDIWELGRHDQPGLALSCWTGTSTQNNRVNDILQLWWMETKTRPFHKTWLNANRHEHCPNHNRSHTFLHSGHDMHDGACGSIVALPSCSSALCIDKICSDTRSQRDPCSNSLWSRAKPSFFKPPSSCSMQTQTH